MTKTAYGQLKQYLMLTRPEKMDAAWFATTLMQDWSQRSGIADAVWQGSGPSLLAFYAASLASHPQWRLPVDDGLVSQVRTRLIRQMGQRNSESTLYQKMLAQVANQYADMRLADMTATTMLRVCSALMRWCRACLPVRPGSRPCSRPLRKWSRNAAMKWTGC